MSVTRRGIKWLAPASQAWWSDQAAKASRVVAAMGWATDDDAGGDE